MSLSGGQINLVDVNFRLQKTMEFFDNKSADKVKSEKDKGIKVPSLMLIRINSEMPCVGHGTRISSTQTEQWLPRQGGAYLRTIHILRQQKTWMGGFRNWQILLTFFTLFILT
jgi:hypothetical protein